jgi:prepilin-type processing-associated H-X9-DG protein
MKRDKTVGALLILGIVGAIVFLSFLGTGSPRIVQRSNCFSNLKQIGLGLGMYADAHQGGLPAENGAKGLDHLVQEQILTKLEVFVCSRDRRRRVAQLGAPLTEDNCSYVYHPAVWQSGTDTNLLPVCWDKPGNHGANGFNVLFNDGHVQFMNPDEWEKIKPKQ